MQLKKGAPKHCNSYKPSFQFLLILLWPNIQVPKKQKRDGPKVPNSGKGKGPQPAKPEERMNPLQSQLEEENAALRAELVVMQGEFLVERQLTRRLQEALLDRIGMLLSFRSPSVPLRLGTIGKTDKFPPQLEAHVGPLCF